MTAHATRTGPRVKAGSAVRPRVSGTQSCRSVSGWISTCLNDPRLFKIQFPLNLATSLVANGPRVVKLLRTLTLGFDQLTL